MNRSYARASSRGLTNFHRKLFASNQELFLNTDNNPKKDILDFLSNNSKHQIWLEIGFGYGDFILKALQIYNNIAIIGCDPYKTGGFKLLSKLAKLAKQSKLSKLHNYHNNHITTQQMIPRINDVSLQKKSLDKNNLIQAKFSKRLKLCLSDFYQVLDSLPKNSIDKVFTLFPDPWPKSKQKKRRLVGNNFLKTIHTKLAISGQLIFASDHLDYYQAVKQSSLSLGLFSETQNDTIITQIPTKYKIKAIRQNLSFDYLTLNKNN